ncbi:unnamed protein product [Heterobilharzia americana]|nr:unnamed protein product [Heterobilharzia americana]
MHFGLTQRELVQYTQEAQPNVLKPGVINEVVKVLVRHYEKCEDERIQNLAEVERKRIGNLEAETELKHIHLCIKRQPRTPCEKRRQKSQKPSTHWMDTQKPGMHPPPNSHKNKILQEKGLSAEKKQIDQDNLQKEESPQDTSSDQVGHPEKQHELDPELCLHLPLGMIRYPTPRTRNFLAAQASCVCDSTANSVVNGTFLVM